MRVILADSNEIVRIGLRTLLSTDKNIQIVGEAKSDEELVALNRSFDASVVLIDFTSKGFSIDVIAKLIKRKPTTNIVAITPEQSAQTLVNALRLGVKSYVKKDCDPQEIIDAIKETCIGKKFFCGQILETIRDAAIDVEDIELDAFSCEPVSLSDRETEIIILISEGLTNTQIAEQLYLSNHTINTHRKNIMAKLGVKNTAGIVMFAVKTQLVSPNRFLFAIN